MGSGGIYFGARGEERRMTTEGKKKMHDSENGSSRFTSSLIKRFLVFLLNFVTRFFENLLALHHFSPRIFFLFTKVFLSCGEKGLLFYPSVSSFHYERQGTRKIISDFSDATRTGGGRELGLRSLACCGSSGWRRCSWYGTSPQLFPAPPSLRIST